MQVSKNKLFYSVLAMFCSACSNPQIVKETYPIWGEEIYLQQPKKQLYMQIRAPEHSEVKGCLLIVHGMNEHVGRYQTIAQHFSKHFIVAGVDLAAHGLSNPYLRRAHEAIKTGVSEYDVSDAYLEQAQLNDLTPMREDLQQALAYLSEYCNKTLSKKAPIFILSHSLGSLVSASYLIQDSAVINDKISGIIFSGPAFSVTQVPGWRGWFQNPVINFSFHIHQHFLHSADEPLPLLIFNQSLSLLTVPSFDAAIEFFSLPCLRQLFSPSTPDWVIEYLSDSEEQRQSLRRDNYIIRRTILRYVLGIEQEIIQFRRQMQNFNVPYFLVYSELDPITPAWGNEDFVALTLKNHPDNTVIPLPGAYHHEQLFSSSILQHNLLQKIDEWLELRLTQPDNMR